KNTNKTLIKLALITMALTDCGNGVTSAALGVIQEAWPQYSATMIQMLGSVTAIFLGFTPVLFYTPLAKFLRKRSILWLGTLFFVVGGAGPAFLTESFIGILVLRALLGIGIGIVTPLGVDCICAFFEGNERRTMMGFLTAAIGASGIMFQTLGAWLCGISWNYTFLAYLAGAALLGFSILFLPEPPKQEKTFDTPMSPKVKEKMPVGVWLYTLMFFLGGMAFYSAVGNVAMVAIGEGFMVPLQIGMAFNLMTLACFICGLIFGPVSKKASWLPLPLGFTLEGAGLLICSQANSFPMMAVGLFFVGFFLGWGTAGICYKTTTLAPTSSIALASALPFFATNTGQFFEPAIFNYFVGAGRTPMIVGGILAIVLAVTLAIMEKAIPCKMVQD
ncbi:MAG TPA: MFS transporter, partial [Anaerovoracaceae bacterium]|nr:MFS transporter [Anaerovoracaceae bacterium]